MVEICSPSPPPLLPYKALVSCVAQVGMQRVPRGRSPGVIRSIGAKKRSCLGSLICFLYVSPEHAFDLGLKYRLEEGASSNFECSLAGPRRLIA